MKEAETESPLKTQEDFGGRQGQRGEMACPIAGKWLNDTGEGEGLWWLEGKSLLSPLLPSI